jgi:L-asparagine oxygenase
VVHSNAKIIISQKKKIKSNHTMAAVRCLVLLLVAASSAAGRSSAFEGSAGRSSVARVDLPPSAFEGFRASWSAAFPAGSPIYSYDAQAAPLEAQEAFAAACAHSARWLPADVVAQLLSFQHDPRAPCALLITGLPIDELAPPTPGSLELGEPPPAGAPAEQAAPRAPVAESWLLGISRLLGHPMVVPGRESLARGGVLFDMAPSAARAAISYAQTLRLHRDYPNPVVGHLATEPEVFTLLAIRAAETGVASTLVIDGATVVRALDPADVALLSSDAGRVQAEVFAADGTLAYVQGAPFVPIQPTEGEEPLVTMFTPVTIGEQTGRIVSAAGNPEATAAYARMEARAHELAEHVSLRPGDALVLNNRRCVHGRSAFTPSWDGRDRWVLKVYTVSGRSKLCPFPSFAPSATRAATAEAAAPAAGGNSASPGTPPKLNID